VVVLQEGSDGAARRCRNATGGALTRSSSRCYNCIFLCYKYYVVLLL
jgi:hypothetical protein